MTRMRRRGLGVVGVLMVGVVGFSPVGPAHATSMGSITPQHPARCHPIFGKKFGAALHRSFPNQRVTADVQDMRTGCVYHLRPKLRITTASVIKAQVLGAVLLHAQDDHRGLDARELHDIHPMIRWSYNDPYVPDLYDDVGGVPGMNRFDHRMHANHTTNTTEFGGTVTTSSDRTNIVRRMLYGGGPMHARYRKIAWSYMSDVTPTQRWGITAGKRKGWTVALKNGFYPEPGYDWRVGSTGFIRAPHSKNGYAITVMTDHDVTQVDGIQLVEKVVRRVAARLQSGPVGHRVVDRSHCLTVLGSTSWSSVASRLGTTDVSGVRRVSGGNPDPLHGQRACSPTLRKTHSAA